MRPVGRAHVDVVRVVLRPRLLLEAAVPLADLRVALGAQRAAVSCTVTLVPLTMPEATAGRVLDATALIAFEEGHRSDHVQSTTAGTLFFFAQVSEDHPVQEYEVT